MTPIIHPVLLCGGSGTRLWPLSRKSYPKQFVELTSEESLYQASARRLSGPGFAAPTIVTAADFRFIVIEQLAALEILPADILIEPAAKNTAAAICAAALALDAREPGALMLVAPSDHVIPDAERFQAAVAGGGTDGPSRSVGDLRYSPEQAGDRLWLARALDPTPDFAPEPQPLKGFVEKPDLATAEALLAGGMHLWNAGIFLFSTTAILEAFGAYAPEVLSACRAAFEGAEKDLSFTRLAPEPWDTLPDISIDYAVMEKAPNLSVVPYDGAWSDLGDWQAVWREAEADASGTVTTGPATALECQDTLLHAASEDQQADRPWAYRYRRSCHARCGSGCPQGPRPRGQAGGCHAEVPRRGAGRDPAPRLPPLGLVREPGGWPAVSGQSASSSTPARRCPCKATTTEPSTGSWSKARPK